MRFYTPQHQFSCGIDLHARTMYGCILKQDGEMRVPRDMTASPDTFLKAIAPYRDGIVVAVECLLTWYWLADLCAQEGIPFVLGHALSLKAIHGGKAKNDRIDAHKMAVLLRGGRLPQAYVYPANMRAPRDLLRRRMSLMRHRAELLTPIQNTHSQSNLPDIGTKIASKANRDGVAERFPDPAVHKSIAVDLALIGHDDQRLRTMELSILQTAQPHHTNTLSWLRTVPGIGAILSLVLLYAIHESARFPRGQDVVSSCRLVKCAKAAAGKRSGTSGTKSGNAYLTWACSEAAVLFLQDHPAGQQELTRLEKKPGKGKALTILAHTWARAVSLMLQRPTAFEMDQFLNGSGSRAGEPDASLDREGMSLQSALCKVCSRRRCTPRSA
jgi:transposase